MRDSCHFTAGGLTKMVQHGGTMVTTFEPRTSTFATLYVRHLFGVAVSGDELARAADEALREGAKSIELSKLTIIDSGRRLSTETRAHLDAAAQELGLGTLSTRTSVLQVAETILWQIVSGGLVPHTGGLMIEKLSSRDPDAEEFEKYYQVVGIALEWEDLVDMRAGIEEAIVEEAREFLGLGANVA